MVRLIGSFPFESVGPYLAPIWPLFGPYLAPIWPLFGHYLAPIWLRAGEAAGNP